MALFEHYPATPGSISAVAATAGAAATSARSLGTDVSSACQVASTNVWGDLQPPMVAAPRPVVSTSTQIAGAALVAQGVLNRWCQAVTDYNAGIDELNARYAAAQANDFGVDADTYFAHGTAPIAQKQASYDQAVRNADASLRASLSAEKAKLDAALDAEATTVASMLNTGPTDEVAMALVAGGHIPPNTVGLVGEIWSSLRGQVIPPTTMGGWGVGLWGLGRAGSLFGLTASWMSKVQFGRFSPRIAGRYVAVDAPWYTTAMRGMKGSNWQAKPYASVTRANWAAAGKWVGRAGGVLGMGTAGLNQWTQDANRTDLDTAAKVGRAATRGVVAGGAGWAGAWAGAQLGAGIGTAIGGPVGTVVGGFVGGVVGGVIGSGIGNEVADHVVDFAGDVADQASQVAHAAVDDVKDAAGKVADFFGF